VIDLVARPAAEAFLQVTVFVAVMIGLFGYLERRFGTRMTRFLAAQWRLGPLLGALVGVVPGCGGAIFVMPLYARSQVSFGTVVAALVATMGDSSFVVIAADPELALALHAVLFAVGLLSGYIVDLSGYAPKIREPAEQAVGGGGSTRSVAVPARVGRPPSTVAGARDGPRRAGSWSPEGWFGPGVFWLLVALGAVVAVPEILHGVDPLEDPGDMSFVGWIGVAGTIGAFALGSSQRRTKCRAVTGCQHRGLSEVLHVSAYESARIGMWVAVVFAAMEIVTELGVPVLLIASLTGLAGVLAGAALGLIPGCAPQIIMTGLYIGGMLPFPTLLANALSQDGDALLPLLLMERRAAIAANLLTTVPGLVGGAVVLSLGWEL
jgi:hypothetical protein